ncbi:MAG: hypothetical protein JWP29_1682 [Rhodoferax sp.]|nr:hypothetical protein [Rhodoferax sp.]
MNQDASTDQKALAAEMRGIAQTAIIAWFADLLRVRIATQSPTQRALTMAMLEEGLATTMLQHACQNLPKPLSETDTLKASLFKDAFKALSMELLTTMGSGLSTAEQAALQ